MSKVRDLLVRISADGSELETELNKTARSLDAVGRRFSSIGRDLTLKFTAPLIAAGAIAAKFASDFETEMTKLVTLVGVAEDQMEEWRGAILDLGPALGKAPEELARAMFVITSAGERGANALSVLEAAGKASAAGLGDTAEIARTVVAAMQAYGSESLSAERATDILVATVREGNLEASELAGSLGRVLGVASQVGVSFDEVGGFVATFTRLGVSAQEAVVALRGTLNTLLKPTTDSEAALRGVGLSTEALRRAIQEQGLTRSLLEMVRAFEGNTSELARVIPNVRALAGVLGTAAAQGDGFLEITDNITNSTGILDDAFDRVQRTTAFTAAQFKASAQAIAIAVGDGIAPAASDLLRSMLPALQTMRHVDAETVKLVASTLAFAAALPPLIWGLGVTARTAATLVRTFSTMAATKAAIGALLAPGGAVVVGLGALAFLLGRSRIEAVKASVEIARVRAELVALNEEDRSFMLEMTQRQFAEATREADEARQALKDYQAELLRTGRPTAILDEVEDTGNQRQLGQLARAAREAQAEVDRLAGEIALLQDAEERAARRAEDMAKAQDEARRSAREFAEELAAGIGDIDATGRAVRGVADVFADLANRMDVASGLGELLGDDVDQAALEVAALESALRELLSMGLKPTDERIGAIVTQLRALRSEMAGAAEDAAKLNDEQRLIAQLLAAATTPMERYQQQVEALAGALTAGRITQEEYNRALGAADEALRRATEEVVVAGRTWEDEWAAAVVSATGTVSLNFKSMADDIIRQIARITARLLAMRALMAMLAPWADAGGIGGALFSAFSAPFGGSRAVGGPVQPGRIYRVNEHGPEAFIPQSAGRIVPNHQLAGGGASPISLSLSVPQSSNPIVLARDADWMAAFDEMVAVAKANGINFEVG